MKWLQKKIALGEEARVPALIEEVEEKWIFYYLHEKVLKKYVKNSYKVFLLKKVVKK